MTRTLSRVPGLAGHYCRSCGNTVDSHHVPDSDDCREARRERTIAQSDD